jgi:hypothetical protein
MANTTSNLGVIRASENLEPGSTGVTLTRAERDMSVTLTGPNVTWVSPSLVALVSPFYRYLYQGSRTTASLAGAEAFHRITKWGFDVVDCGLSPTKPSRHSYGAKCT